ncbi:MAG TPA: polysaccharide biosynthesis/export family protein [Bacteroidales bacterium]|nr:polysaccharide biosynthesis/export family protein [Bacteroidales bacterium]
MAAALLVLVSCIPQKKGVYLQDAERHQGKAYPMAPPPEYRIRPGDNLFIRVTGWDAKTFDFFNPGRNTGEQGGMGDSWFYFNGYPVDEGGQVNLPVLGGVKVGGLNLTEATDTVQRRVDGYLVGGRVSLRLANFSVTVLGEVGAPGRINVFDDQVTIFDVLSQCGDITLTGDRTRVSLVRQQGDTAYTYTLDLTQAHMLSNELLYLQPDDLIYVEPVRARIFSWNAAQTGGILSLVLSAITLISLLTLR